MQPSRKYFEDRIRKNKEKVIAMEEKDIARLKRVYRANIKDIDNQIVEFYNKYGENYTEQLSLFETKQLKKKLRAVVKETPSDVYLKKKLKDIAPKYKIDRLEELKTQLQMQYTAITSLQEKEIAKTVINSGLLTAELNKIMFERVGMYGLQAVNAKKIELISRQKWVSNTNWSQKIWKDRAIVGQKVEKILSTGLPQGKPLQVISKQLKEATGNSYNNAFRLIRTEASFVDNQVIIEQYNELGLEKYEYSAILDNKTSEICEELDGQIFLLAESQVGVNTPPSHSNCRSTILPIMD